MNIFLKIKDILAPQTGKIIPIEDVTDPIFSEKILGDGVAIYPCENKVLAPISGKICQFAKTYHSICIKGEDNITVLIHLGINTLKLKGKGFKPKVDIGKIVSAGDELLEMDIDFIKSQGFDITTPCIITNTKNLKKIKLYSGHCIAGKTNIISYK